MQVIYATRQNVFDTVTRSKFEAIFDSNMRTQFAILGLLLCLIATRADELPVIKDSEAIRYVGKSVEVRGFVVHSV
jgi:hypothetical protein